MEAQIWRIVLLAPIPATARRPLRPHKELLIAWALLLLDDDDAVHGYRLHQELRARGLDLQATSLYRWLRKFERDRWVSSSWSEPVDGPPRHVYRLTPEGRRTLQELSTSIAASRDTYAAFLHAHGQAVARHAESSHRDATGPVPAPRDPHRPAPDPPATAALEPLRPHRELLVGWLLLLLDAGATYGYDLRREFDARRLSLDPAVMYRMLRRLENDKWVQSRWLSPAAGPRRRFYRLTTRGRRNLDEIAGLIAAMRDVHDRYLREHEHARSAPSHGR